MGKLINRKRVKWELFASNGILNFTRASNAMLHSFSVLDIQKMRNNLKSSKSYPHDLKEKVSEEEEEEKTGTEERKEVSAKMDVKQANNPPAPAPAATKVVKQVAPKPETTYSAPVAVTAAPETKKSESQLLNVSELQSVNQREIIIHLCIPIAATGQEECQLCQGHKACCETERLRFFAGLQTNAAAAFSSKGGS